jgi:hypothetical protein
MGFSTAGPAADAVLAVFVAAAYAVPAELNMETSGGNPIAIRAPAAVIPFSSDLRDVLTRSVIICDMLEFSLFVGAALTGHCLGKVPQDH